MGVYISELLFDELSSEFVDLLIQQLAKVFDLVIVTIEASYQI